MEEQRTVWSSCHHPALQIWSPLNTDSVFAFMLVQGFFSWWPESMHAVCSLCRCCSVCLLICSIFCCGSCQTDHCHHISYPQFTHSQGANSILMVPFYQTLQHWFKRLEFGSRGWSDFLCRGIKDFMISTQGLGSRPGWLYYFSRIRDKIQL